MNVFVQVGGSGGRLSTQVGDLRDVRRRGRRLQGRLETFAVGKDDRRGGVPLESGLCTVWREQRLCRRQRRKQR